MKLGSISDKEIIRRLKREGWTQGRQTGGHIHWFHAEQPHRRVTTSVTHMSPHVKRSIYRQAGWLWNNEVQEESGLEQELRKLDKENEQLRRELHELLESIDALTAPPRQVSP